MPDVPLLQSTAIPVEAGAIAPIAGTVPAAGAAVPLLLSAVVAEAGLTVAAALGTAGVGVAIAGALATTAVVGAAATAGVAVGTAGLLVATAPLVAGTIPVVAGAVPALAGAALPVLVATATLLAPVVLVAGSSEGEHLALLISDAENNVVGFFENLFKTAKDIAAANLQASLDSFLSLRPQPKIMNGARAIIRINGQVSGLCTNCSYEINTDWAEIRGLDDLLPNDLAPTIYSVRGTLGLYRIPNGSPIGKFLTSDMFQSIIWPYTTIEIKDKRTDELLVLLKRCAITSQGEAYRKGELTVTNLSFVSIGFRDEQIPQLLPSKLPKDESGNAGLIGAIKDIAGKLGF